MAKMQRPTCDSRAMKKLLTALASALALAGTAQASLVLQANGVEVLDTETNLVWLQNWGASGELRFEDAVEWAAGLTLGGATAGQWRLPSIDEFHDLYMQVGGSYPGLTTYFSNVWVHYTYYWSSTDYLPVPGTFQAFNPNQWSYQYPGEWGRVAAVRVYDVAAIPEPATLSLVVAAVLGVTSLGRRKPAARTA